MKRLIAPLLILLLGITLASLLSANKKDQKRSVPKAQITTVSAIPVKFSDLTPTIESTGRVKPLERVMLTPEVSGIILDKDFRLRKGTTFKKDQIIVRIDSRQAENNLQSAISDLLNSLAGFLPELKSDLPEAYGSWQVFFEALSPNHIPQIPTPLSQREKLLATRHNVFKLYYAVKNHYVILEKHTLRAPFSGTVEESQISQSSMARSGVTLATIANTDEMEIEFTLSVEDARLIEKKSECKIFDPSLSTPIPATIDRISNIIDEKMQSVPVFIKITNATTLGLLSGSYVTITIDAKVIPNAVVVPRKALYTGNRVYIIDQGKLAERVVRPVYIGTKSVYLDQGISHGDLIIEEPMQDAVLGMKVQSLHNDLSRSVDRTIAPVKKEKKMVPEKEGNR